MSKLLGFITVVLICILICLSSCQPINKILDYTIEENYINCVKDANDVEKACIASMGFVGDVHEAKHLLEIKINTCKKVASVQKSNCTSARNRKR